MARGFQDISGDPGEGQEALGKGRRPRTRSGGPGQCQEAQGKVGMTSFLYLFLSLSFFDLWIFFILYFCLS